jgi:hypothetical protein
LDICALSYTKCKGLKEILSKVSPDIKESLVFCLYSLFVTPKVKFVPQSWPLRFFHRPFSPKDQLIGKMNVKATLENLHRRVCSCLKPERIYFPYFQTFKTYKANIFK